jgi:hypothetical protein
MTSYNLQGALHWSGPFSGNLTGNSVGADVCLPGWTATDTKPTDDGPVQWECVDDGDADGGPGTWRRTGTAKSSFVICGDLDDINNSDHYYGPAIDCDITDTGDSTEANVDLTVYEDGFYATSISCRTASDPGADVVFTLRDDEGDTTVSCTVASGTTLCSDVERSALVAASSNMAIEGSSTGSIGAVGFSCGIGVDFIQ